MNFKKFKIYIYAIWSIKNIKPFEIKATIKKY